MSGQGFTLPAFAKVNLALRVLGRRGDGYHEIWTIFQTISLSDALTFQTTQGGRLELVCSDPELPTDERNLVHKAATALRARFDVSPGARITIEKRIPTQGGLGGGSSDAAATLIGLARLWRLDVSTDELAEIGSRIGADVPFFLTGGTALGTGTGTDITPLEDPPQKHLVVITPAVKISTAEAYKALNATALTKGESVANLSVSRTEPLTSGSLCELMHNDFEGVVAGLEPEVGRAREALREAGARHSMLSGSGSSVFGVFENRVDAEHAAEALRLETTWTIFPCATLSRAEYLEALGR